MQSTSVDVATPTSTLLCTASGNFVHVEYPVEEAAELSVDESPVEEAVVEDVNEKSLADEPISASEELEVGSQKSDPIYFDWRPFSSKENKKKTKKKKSAFTIWKDLAEVPAEEPPAEIEGGHPLDKVCDAYEYIEEDHPLPKLESKSYLVEECEELKEDKLPPTPSPSPTLYGCQPKLRDTVQGTLRSGTPLLPESVGHPISASSGPAAAAPTEITSNNLQALVAQSRRAIVFKIEFPNEISTKSLLVMTTTAKPFSHPILAST